MATRQKLTFWAASGFLIPGLFFLAAKSRAEADVRALEYLLIFHWAVYAAVLVSLYFTARRNSHKVLFVYLIAGGMKIIFSGLFFAFVLAWTDVQHIKVITFFFLAVYAVLLVVETGFARVLLASETTHSTGR